MGSAVFDVLHVVPDAGSFISQVQSLNLVSSTQTALHSESVSGVRRPGLYSWDSQYCSWGSVCLFSKVFVCQWKR